MLICKGLGKCPSVHKRSPGAFLRYHRGGESTMQTIKNRGGAGFPVPHPIEWVKERIRPR